MKASLVCIDFIKLLPAAENSKITLLVLEATTIRGVVTSEAARKEMFCKKAVLKIFGKLTVKHL